MEEKVMFIYGIGQLLAVLAGMKFLSRIEKDDLTSSHMIGIILASGLSYVGIVFYGIIYAFHVIKDKYFNNSVEIYDNLPHEKTEYSSSNWSFIEPFKDK